MCSNISMHHWHKQAFARCARRSPPYFRHDSDAPDLKQQVNACRNAIQVCDDAQDARTDLRQAGVNGRRQARVLFSTQRGRREKFRCGQTSFLCRGHRPPLGCSRYETAVLHQRHLHIRLGSVIVSGPWAWPKFATRPIVRRGAAERPKIRPRCRFGFEISPEPI